MIKYRWNEAELDLLLGKYIFHATRGGSVLLSTPGFLDAPNKVGEYLGCVKEITGKNRIFYDSEDGDTKYVSIGGIGYVCDTKAESDNLIGVSVKYRDKAKACIESILSEMRADIEALSKY